MCVCVPHYRPKHRGGPSRGDTQPPRRPVTPPRGPLATSPARRRKPRRKVRSPPRHSEREEDQGEPRTSAGPPTTEPTEGGQPVLPEASSNTAQRVDEEFLHQLMTAERADVQSQLDVIMEGIGPTDHVSKGLSTLSQFLLYCQQLLNNPGLGLWIVADWKALRTKAGEPPSFANISGLLHP